jgi:hypothetical protein
VDGLMEGYADDRTDGSLDVRINGRMCRWEE